jgi:hypothetical protein
MQFDFEMHTVHAVSLTDAAGLEFADSGIVGGVQGIIFDTKNYDKSVTKEEIKIIDAFFDSMNFDKLDPDSNVREVDVGMVPYGQLMNMLNTKERWVYQGSLTTPPCTEKVAWNVAKKVYPINGKHLQYFQYLLGKEMRTLQAAGVNPPNINMNGNYRVVQPIKKQNPKLMVPADANDEDDTEYTNKTLLIILLFGVGLVIIFTGINCMIYNNAKEREDQKAKDLEMQKRQKLYGEDPDYSPAAPDTARSADNKGKGI